PGDRRGGVLLGPEDRRDADQHRQRREQEAQAGQQRPVLAQKFDHGSRALPVPPPAHQSDRWAAASAGSATASTTAQSPAASGTNSKNRADAGQYSASTNPGSVSPARA